MAYNEFGIMRWSVDATSTPFGYFDSTSLRIFGTDATRTYDLNPTAATIRVPMTIVGNTGITGTLTVSGGLTVTSNLALAAAAGSNTTAYITSIGSTPNSSLSLRRARDAGSGNPADTISGESLGRIYGVGYANSAYQNACYIHFGQDGTSSGSYIPGKIVVYTGTSAAAPAVALTIASDKTATFSGAVSINGNVTLGDASTDTITCTGRLLLRQVSSVSNLAGSKGGILFCTGDNKVYVCTVSSESAATWVALN